MDTGFASLGREVKARHLIHLKPSTYAGLAPSMASCIGLYYLGVSLHGFMKQKKTRLKLKD